MQALAKMESLANIHMRQQRVPSESGDFGQMVYQAKMVNMANIHQSLSKTSNEMAKGQFERDDFNEKGEFGENGKNGAPSPKFGECS